MYSKLGPLLTSCVMVGIWPTSLSLSFPLVYKIEIITVPFYKVVIKDYTSILKINCLAQCLAYSKLWINFIYYH